MKHLPLLGVILISLLLPGCHVIAVSSPGHRPVVVVPAGPPAIVVVERPRLVFVAEYGIYFAPELEVDLYFDHGIWFYFYDRAWYKSSDYQGPWSVVHVNHLPPGLRKIPPGHLKKTFKEIEAKEKVKAQGKGKEKGHQ